jgi:divalent metal cation (Fe/Co/Zn/Cd) transporter
VTAERLRSMHLERRAQQLIAASFVLRAGYVPVESSNDLISARHPNAKLVGIGLSLVTLLTMPPLAAAKQPVGLALASSATTSESRQKTLCAYHSAALLIGLLSNVILGCLGPTLAVALVTGAVALREARDARRGDSCGCC